MTPKELAAEARWYGDAVGGSDGATLRAVDDLFVNDEVALRDRSVEPDMADADDPAVAAVVDAVRDVDGAAAARAEGVDPGAVPAVDRTADLAAALAGRLERTFALRQYTREADPGRAEAVARGGGAGGLARLSAAVTGRMRAAAYRCGDGWVLATRTTPRPPGAFAARVGPPPSVSAVRHLSDRTPRAALREEYADDRWRFPEGVAPDAGGGRSTVAGRRRGAGE